MFLKKVIDMFVKRGEWFLPSVNLSKLEELYAQEKNAKAKIRLQCAILRKKGKAQPFIAKLTGKPVTTVSDILRRFEKKGLRGCYAIKQQGQPRKLSVVQRVKLKRIVSQSPVNVGLPFKIWTTKLVQYIIRKSFGKDYVLMQVYRLLASMGLSLQQARPEHIKANKRLQEEFKKTSMNN